MEVKHAFTDFLEIIPDGAVVINPHGFIVAVNQAAASRLLASSHALFH